MEARDTLMGQAIFEQLLELWVDPEVERRQAMGRVERPLILRAAQVVFFSDGRPREIRVNDEVRAVARICLARDRQINKGDPVYFADVGSVETLALPEDDDPNAGHITAWRVGQTWYITLDCRYNKALIREHVSVAEEFIAAAKECVSRGWLHPAVDNLYSAAELAAKSVLLSHQGVRLRTSHRAIRGRLNRWGSIGNLEVTHVNSFDQLDRARRCYRYLEGRYEVDRG